MCEYSLLSLRLVGPPLYYSPEGYRRGKLAIKKLAAVAKVSQKAAGDWLNKQAYWQTYLSAPYYIARPMIAENRPNKVPQANCIYRMIKSADTFISMPWWWSMWQAVTKRLNHSLTSPRQKSLALSRAYTCVVR